MAKKRKLKKGMILILGIILFFGVYFEAFKYGVPPHGGIAPGLDRLLMVLLKEKNLREVTAFPLTSDGRDPMMDSPSEVSSEQLAELKIKTL